MSAGSNDLRLCAKFGCQRCWETVELQTTGPGAEKFPNALCFEHAHRPDKKGTFVQPTVVRR